MEIGNCETCNNWNTKQKACFPAGKSLGGVCMCDRFVEDEYYESDMLVYSYQENGEFWTGPKFGCVHWSSK